MEVKINIMPDTGAEDRDLVKKLNEKIKTLTGRELQEYECFTMIGVIIVAPLLKITADLEGQESRIANESGGKVVKVDQSFCKGKRCWWYGIEWPKDADLEGCAKAIANLLAMQGVQ